MNKNCAKCNENKPLLDFHKNKRYEDGRNKICKCCKKEYDSFNYLEHKEKKMNQIEIWQMLNVDKVQATKAKWRAKRKAKNETKTS